MAALPYIQLYVSDYLADTMHLTTEEHGAYLLLIMNYWQTGKPIPKSRLQKIARLDNERWLSVEDSLSEFFSDNGSEWTHSRIEDDLADVRDAQAQRVAAGKASAAAKKRQKREQSKRENNDRSAPVEDSFEREGNENSTNIDTDTDTDKDKDKNTDSGASDDAPTCEKESAHPKKFTDAEFEDFWRSCRDNWHGSVGTKAEARKEFDKLKRGDTNLPEITRLTVVECQARKRQQDSEGFAESMKHACRWIKYRGWQEVEDRPRRGFSAQLAEMQKAVGDCI